ncbi:MAG TPA: type II toxin-antitoxin system HicA family toxin [Acetobacteraceae bacterium]|nr:type II toxin-antitoxin system HicA family toxin [Acetobacteraceae bacterium]
MRASEVVRLLLRDGWIDAGGKGSHRNFRHPGRPGKVTVPMHGSRDLSIGVIRSIEKQSGLTLIPKR